uniref:NB-ARC domain-containing protein n=1 Tax=Leersia perrieri TaxID=77586 RepID=A0A0D9XR40_9ORYZ
MQEELDVQLKAWVNEVQELAYDIEDSIDAFMAHVEQNPDVPLGIKGFMSTKIQKLKKLLCHRKFVGKFLDFKNRVVEANERRRRYEVDECTSITTTSDLIVDPRLPALYSGFDELVGIGGPMDCIIKLLANQADSDSSTLQLKVVSIVGCGETRHGEDLNGFATSSTGDWYLIIIDDIWSISDWNIVKSAFPDNNLRSRIIATTRIMDVAKSCSYNLQCYVHTIQPLNHQDSSRLFIKRIFPSGCGIPQHLKEVSNAILKRCGGLPLAILIIAGLLASKSTRKDEWEAVHNSVGSEMDQNHTLKGFRKILMLSFYDLPHDLKTCFLYLSIFPEDDLIVRENLVWKWIAEGFIRKEHGKRRDQVAERYFNDLINRNMIQAVGVRYSGNIYGCRVHDLVLDIIKSLSAEINFVTVMDNKSDRSFPMKIRRLSLQASNLEDQEMQKLVSSQSHIRSFIMFSDFKQAPDLVNLYALRVLDLSKCSCLENSHIKCLISLFQLRYLSLPCRITELPEQIGNLQHLEVLNISCCQIKRLPESIVKLGKLMCLHVASGVKLPDEIGRMQTLQELESISIPCNSVKLVEEIGKLTRLRRLAVETGITVELGDQEVRYREMLVSSLRLHIKNYIYLVPKWTKMLSSLVRLCLSVTGIEEGDIHVLKGIPTLLSLRLELKKPPQQRLVIGSEGFKYLNELQFFCSYSAMPLRFAPGAMPELHRLRLEFQARETMSMYGDYDFGIQHLSGIRDIRVEIKAEIGCFSRDTDIESKAAKDAITGACIIHPNCPVFNVQLSVTMIYIPKERAQLIGLQSATNEVNGGMEGTFIAYGNTISYRPS